MTDAPATRRPLTTVLLLAATVALLALSTALIRLHLRRLAEARLVTAPLAIQTADAERRAGVLRTQLHALKLQASLTGGSVEEQMRLFVLPQKADLDRTLAFLSGIGDVLRADKRLRSLAPIASGEPVSEGSLVRRRLSFSLTLRSASVPDVLGVLRLSGFLTVEDALSPDDRAALLALAEDEDPSQIPTLKEYFATDLLSYLRAPSDADDRLLSAYTSDAFTTAFRRATRGKVLREGAIVARGPFGDMVRAQKLWPLPFLSLAEATITELSDGWCTLDLALDAYGRA